MDGVLLWLWHKFTAWMESRLNPQAAKEAEEFKAKVAARDALAKENEALLLQSKALYQQHVQEREEWDRRNMEIQVDIQASEERFNAAQARISQRDAETEALKKKLDGLSPADRVRVDL